MASISVMASNGKLATPTGYSWNVFLSLQIFQTLESDAELITFGCCENSGMEFTNPDSFMIFE